MHGEMRDESETVHPAVEKEESERRRKYMSKNKI
jgi:hypothetical protein